MKTTSEIAERLQAEIDASGRSLLSIAKAAGLGYAAVYRIAHRERDGMTIETMLRLAGALGLTVEFKRGRNARAKA
ncbi:MAG: hypothetical protein HOP29_19405 [Phycisphaerales bacterium]|nr:hypothetical protein [Phycisphaerales bacterium]